MTDGAFDRSSLLVIIASHRVHRIRIFVVVVKSWPRTSMQDHTKSFVIGPEACEASIVDVTQGIVADFGYVKQCP